MGKSKKLIREAQEALERLLDSREQPLTPAQREALEIYSLYIRFDLCTVDLLTGYTGKDGLTEQEYQYIQQGFGYRRLEELDLSQEDRDMFIALLKSIDDSMADSFIAVDGKVRKA